MRVSITSNRNTGCSSWGHGMTACCSLILSSTLAGRDSKTHGKGGEVIEQVVWRIML